MEALIAITRFRYRWHKALVDKTLVFRGFSGKSWLKISLGIDSNLFVLAYGLSSLRGGTGRVIALHDTRYTELRIS